MEKGNIYITSKETPMSSYCVSCFCNRNEAVVDIYNSISPPAYSLFLSLLTNPSADWSFSWAIIAFY